ncbi:MAG: trypsin-like peptidase domain-containing protein, partial [bacterium]
RWYRKAAEQGVAEAHNNLGVCYRQGIGVVQDDAQACVHYLIANALSGIDQAQNNLQIIRARLSGAQYAAAQQAATQWVEKFRAGAGQTPDAAIPKTAPTPSDTVKATGSGFVISTDGYFLTCAHVIEGGREIKVRIGDKTHPAKVVRADSRSDVALLKLEGENFTPLALAQSIPEMGDKVFTIGYPNPGIQGGAAKYTDGAVSALSGLQDDVRTMQITASVQGGNSGGVLADAAGNAIGLVVAQINAIAVFEYTGSIPQNVNFAVKINYALPLIQTVPNLARRLPQPAQPAANVSPIKAVEAATGLVIVNE